MKLNPKEFVHVLAEERSKKLKDEEFRKMVERILGVWSDPNHALIELIQNADDAKAKKAKFIFDGKNLFFLHDGKFFSKSDVRHICAVALTTKKVGSYIGFFGIGFKSVFKISNKPHIFSFPFKFLFQRETPIVPEWIEEIPSEVAQYLHKKEKETLFYLPLREDLPQRSKENLKEALQKDFDPLSLAFLRRLKQIDFKVDGEERTLRIKKGKLQGQPLQKGRMIITEMVNKEEKKYNYLLFRKTVMLPPEARSDYAAKETKKAYLKKLDLMFAFGLSNKGSLEVIEGKLFTFLPTPILTGLKFILNSDFILDTSRSDIDWSSRWNLWLLKTVGEFMQDIIPIFKEHEKFRTEFYKVLPRKETVPEKFLDYLVTPILNYSQRNPVVITSDEKWSKPSDAIFASSRFQKLIPVDKGFLKDVGVDELDEQETLFEILQDKAFLQGQNKEWFKQIYEFLCDNLYTDKGWSIPSWKMDEIEERLKGIPFILTSDGRIKRPIDVLLPARGKRQLKQLLGLPKVGSFIDSCIITKKSSKLFKELCCPSFSRETVARFLIERYKNESWEKWTEAERITSLSYLNDWFKSVKWNLPDDLKADLGFIRVPTENAGWARVDRCYFSEGTLKEILPKALFVRSSLLRGKKQKERTKFLTKMGVLKHPRVIKIDEKCDRWTTPKGLIKDRWDEYWEWIEPHIGDVRWQGHGHHLDHAYLPDGFIESLGNQKRMRLYLNYLIKHWADYYKKYLENTYKWHYYSWNPKKVPSFFAFLLKTSSWLPTNEGLEAPSADIFIPTEEMRRVAGHLVTYLDLQEGFAEGQYFYQFIGLSTELDFKTVLLLMKKAENVAPDEKLKCQLERIYDVFSELINEEKLEEDIKLLSDDCSFLSPKSLYWNDDREMGQLFQDKLKFAWMPPNIPKPKLDKIFKFFGVQKLSASLSRTMIFHPSEVLGHHHTEKLLKEKSRFIYSILANFQAMNLDKVPEFFTSVQAYLMKKLRVQLKVKEVEVVYESKVFCDLEEKKLWITEDAELIDVSVELARSFGLPLEHAFHLSWTLGQTDLPRISDNFGRFGIPIIELPREEEIYKPKPMSREEFVEKPPSLTSEYTHEPTEHEYPSDLTTEKISEDWVPECPPEQAEVGSSEEYVPEEITRPLVTREDARTRHVSPESEQPTPPSGTREKGLSEKSKIAIGRWGEEYALGCLKKDKMKEYPDTRVTDTENGFALEKDEKTLVKVVWLNKDDDQGRGHDIELWENDMLYYIEVKSTKTEEKDWFDVSRDQWALMQEKGDKFFIYRVYGAGTRKPPPPLKIRNPARLWREGSIDAYPVRIQL